MEEKATVCHFRCMSTTLDHRKNLRVELQPVIPASPSYPGGAAVNAAFFKATPHGKIELNTSLHDFWIAGNYYQILLTQLPPDVPKDPLDWHLEEVSYTPGALTVKLGRVWNPIGDIVSGSCMLKIENEKAWNLFPPTFPSRYRMDCSALPSPEGQTWP